MAKRRAGRQTKKATTKTKAKAPLASPKKAKPRAQKSVRTAPKKKHAAKATPAKKAAPKKAVAKKAAPKQSAPKKHAAPKHATAKHDAAKHAKVMPATTKQAMPKGVVSAKAARRAITLPPDVALASFEQVQHFSAPPALLYHAWLDGAEHTAFTGGEATVDPRVGGIFTAWNGYIRGKNVELTPGERIVQEWRTSEFPVGYPDSVLELHFIPESGGTRLHMRHVGVPAHQANNYESGWHDHYWQPLRAWLATHAVS